MAKELEPLQTLRCDVSERDVINADKAAEKHREDRKAGINPIQHQQTTLTQLAKLRTKKGTDLGVFAADNKLTFTLDEDDEPIAIPGTNGAIFRHPDYGLSLNFQGLSDVWIPRLRDLVGAGATPVHDEHINSDPHMSGCVSFDPADERQVALILKHADIQPKKRGTEASRAKAGERLKAGREARRVASWTVVPDPAFA
jgi:hypothetical protein